MPSKSGLTGAVPHKSGKFQSIIGANGIRRYLGLYDTAELANEAYLKAKHDLHIDPYVRQR